MLIKFFLLMILLAPSQGQAEESITVLATQASMHYQAGDFGAAIDSYQKILATGHVSADLFYNLAIVEYRQGRLGPAVAAALAARYYQPDDPDLGSNLRFLLTQIDDKLAADMTEPAWAQLFFWRHMASQRSQVICCLLLTAIMFLFFGLFIYNRRPVGLWLAIVFLAADLVMAAGYGVVLLNKQDWGAVVAPEVFAYSAPNPEVAKALFRLNEGAPIRILARNRLWSKVSLADGKVGWVKNENVLCYTLNSFVSQANSFQSGRS